MDDLLRALKEVVGRREAYLVGGWVRDRLLGRSANDLDLVVAGSVQALAFRLAKRLGAAAFPLGGAHGIWRVTVPAGSFTIDLEPLGDQGLTPNLRRRDFTINALATTLELGEVIDPLGGRADLAAKLLRVTGPAALRADPLRVLRLARLAVTLGFRVERESGALARAAAPALAGVAGERLRAELVRIVASPAPVEGLALLEELGAQAVVLPELSALQGVPQNRYHHLDAYRHTLSALDHLAALERVLGGGPAGGVEGAAELVHFCEELGPLRSPLARLLGFPLGDELTRGGALRFAVLLHDLGKADCRSKAPDGRLIFPGHERRGAELAGALLRRLRFSRRLVERTTQLVRHHLDLGFLVYRPEPLAPLNRFRYLRPVYPLGVDLTLLSVADRLATRGARAGEAIGRHLDLAAALLPAALAFEREGPPRPLVGGEELARAVGIRPGPLLGRLLAALAEAQYVGEVRDVAGALAWARRAAASKAADA